MAIQLNGIQWTEKEEVLGLSEFAFKSLHSDARMSYAYWDAHTGASESSFALDYS